MAIGEVQSALVEVDELKKNGLKGDPGQAATVEVGTVTASEPGSAPSVTNAGTEQAAVLDFVLPRGEQGPKGADGAAGKDGKEQIVFAGASSFPTTGDPAMLYVDNTVSPAVIYTWDGSSYVQASADIGTVMAMLATPFSATESYTAGKYVTYNGQYWRFTADKTAGAWDASKAEATNIGAELSALNTKIGSCFPVPDYENAVTINTNTYTAPADGWVSAFASRAANGASVSAPLKAIIYVNDIRVSEAVSTSGYPSARLSPVPVRAGDNIKYDVAGQSGGGALRYFYPIRL